MVLTRGKTHGNAEGDNDRLLSEGEANDEDRYDDQHVKNRVIDEKRNLRSDFCEKSRETPTPTGSSFSQNPQRSSRSNSKKGKFVFDLSCEESPLAIRVSNTDSNKGKRLKLYSEDEDHEPRRRKPIYIDNSSSESDEDDSYKRNTRRRNQYYNEGEALNLEEHGDGIRRSTRQRKLLYGSFNTSWIFGTQTVKGYPTFEEEEAEGKRRSSRIRTRQMDDMDEVEGVEDGDHEAEEREEEEEEERGDAEKLQKKRKPVKRNRRIVKSDKKMYEDDMYSRVKRLRRSATHYASYRTTISNATKPRRVGNCRNSRRRRRYPMVSEDSSLETESDNDEDIEQEIADEEERESKEKEHDKEEAKNLQGNENQVIDGRRAKGKYLLRRIQPIVDRFQSMDTKQSSRSSTPPRIRSNSNHRSSHMICSPAHRTLRKRRQTAQNKSSTSSSSSDEERFERRKNKSMIKARNRCLPMNFSPEDLQGIIRDRQKIGSSLADVDPMNIDRNVTFEHVGGLETYIRSLKEMILFPLLYPEIFQKFAIQPPRGVLFYGPPGTGKTLVARALANECSQQDRRVAFFMRKGADCLSKWVGESERQLRLLFDQAYQMRPSIIFFDEIDGLAPVRSTRQDQIHSSIVSTLLALMDGLDSRGEVIVIGATNRLDAIDPALRRPGRFDREFHFPLPSLPARREILGIHLKTWQPSPPANLINYLSEKTVGYCGADLKALCAEAALLALRRKYPQVYQTKDKLLLDLSQILVDRRDFIQAVHRLVPASQRTNLASGKPLSGLVSPLLSNALQIVTQQIQRIFPQGVAVLKVKGPLNGAKLLHSGTQFLPRLMIAGDGCTHLGSALLHYMERLPVHRLDLTTLHGLSVRSPEEACVQMFQEAKRNVPSVLYVPLVGRWWSTVSDTVKATFFTLLNEMDPELPVFLLATHDGSLDDCADDFFRLFDEEDEIFQTPNFTASERRRFFQPIFLEKSIKRPAFKKRIIRNLETLPVAPPPPPRQLSETEKARIERKEEATLRELRIFLREILAKLARNKLFYMFTRPVDIEEVPDYLEIIRQPMDLETMMTKIDQHCYESAKDFLADIELICNNALEYNPDRDPEDKLIRHRACTLRDTAYALIKAEMDTDFEEQCQEISRTRKVRNTRLLGVSEDLSIIPGGEMESKINTVNGELIEQEQYPTANRNRRKRSQWAKGVIGNRRPVKKGKTETEIESLNPENSLPATQSEISLEQEDNEQICLPEAEKSAEGMNDTLADDSQGTESADQVDLAAQPAAEKVVVINRERLEQLLEIVVRQTENYYLEQLLRLYSKLSRCVERYAKQWDRTSLIQDLERISERLAPA